MAWNRVVAVHMKEVGRLWIYSEGRANRICLQTRYGMKERRQLRKTTRFFAYILGRIVLLLMSLEGCKRNRLGDGRESNSH